MRKYIALEDLDSMQIDVGWICPYFEERFVLAREAGALETIVGDVHLSNHRFAKAKILCKNNENRQASDPENPYGLKAGYILYPPQLAGRIAAYDRNRRYFEIVDH